MTTPTIAKMQPVTIPFVGNRLPVQICPSRSGTVNVYNGDLTNVLYVSPSQNPSPTNSVPVQPLTNATIDGNAQQWGLSASAGGCTNVTVGNALQMSPSPAQVAAQINALGLATSALQQTQQNTLVSGIGLPVNAAQEAGGNLATHTSLLNGSNAGALLGVPGNTIGKEIAAWIAGGAVGSTPGGTPLLHGFDTLAANATSVVTPGNTNFPFFTWVKPTYYMVIYCQANVNPTTVPFGTVTFFWKDNNGILIAKEIWYLPVTTGGTSAPTVCRGPVKGPQLTIGFGNPDATATYTYTYTIQESTFPIARDDFRTIDTQGQTTPYQNGFAPGSQLDSLVLISDRETLTSGTDRVYLLPLYGGQVYFQCATSSTSLPIIVNVGIPAQIGVFQNAIIWQDATLTDVTITLALPRLPCYVEFHNTNASSVSITASMIALEYVS